MHTLNSTFSHFIVSLADNFTKKKKKNSIPLPKQMPRAEALAEPSTLVSSRALDSIVIISDVKRGHSSSRALRETS